VAFGREGIIRGELLYLLTLIKMSHAHGEVYLIQHYVIKFKISHAHAEMYLIQHYVIKFKISHAHAEAYSIQNYVIKFISDLRQVSDPNMECSCDLEDGVRRQDLGIVTNKGDLPVGSVVSNNAGDNSTYTIGPLMCSRQEFGKKKLHFH
jgi:hypothetical protein